VNSLLIWLEQGEARMEWRLALSHLATEAVTIDWFTNDKLVSLAYNHATLNLTGNRRGT
jgi:hypothetical protein